MKKLSITMFFMLVFSFLPTTYASAEKIGIMFSESSEKYANTTHPGGKFTSPNTNRVQTVYPKVDYSSTLDKELKAYHMYKQMGYDVEKVSESMLSDVTTLTKFDAIVFPYTVMMNHQQRESLKAYIRAGGGAVFAFQTARNEGAHFPKAGQPDISPLIFHTDSWIFEWDNLTEVFQSRFIDDVVLGNATVTAGNSTHPIVANAQAELGRKLAMTDTSQNWVEIIKPWQNKNNNIQPVLFFSKYDYTDKSATMNADTYGAAHAIQYGKGRVVQIGYKIMDYIHVEANDNWEDSSKGLAFSDKKGNEDAKAFMKSSLNWVKAPNQSNNKRQYNLSLYTDGLQGYVSPRGFVYRSTATVKNNGNVPARGTLKVEVLNSNGKVVGASHQRYLPGLAADATENNADKRDVSKHHEKFEIYLQGLPAGVYTVRTSFTEGRLDQKTVGFKFKTMAEVKTFHYAGGNTHARFSNVPMFRDVSQSGGAYYDIKNLHALGVVTGYNATTFAPTKTITRTQAATMVLRALGVSPSSSATLNVSDLQRGQYGYDVLATAAQYGIVSPQNGRINANAPMTRGDMAQALVNGFKLVGPHTRTFTDVPSTHPQHNAIQTLSALDITTGYQDNSFRPDSAVTRQNFSQFVNRTLFNQAK
ncbi:Endoglucanase precursor [Metalysinibacillus saudimassiliensis]|uniref:Endoglucanase n=1 Tax=Metalysinibacillus saudimassiliensis TaxID=1461583 RepID=A0A078M970_9BACL|nr:Endoglucanase precursor [Metalysinibacillus saudimassiliensis]